MKLAEFFRTVEPLFAERASAAEVARTLFGEGAKHDAARLAFYEHASRVRRADTLTFVFPRVHSHISALWHEHGWIQLATAYFAEAPWREVKPLPNASGFPAFLGRIGQARELAPWLPELADLEWWVASVRSTADDPRDPALGPLRLSAPLELRRYAFDLVSWINDTERAKLEPPVRKPTVVLFWRGPLQIPCVRAVSGAQIRVLAAIRYHGVLTSAWARNAGMSAPEALRVVRGLKRLGVLVGDAWPAVSELAAGLDRQARAELGA